MPALNLTICTPRDNLYCMLHVVSHALIEALSKRISTPRVRATNYPLFLSRWFHLAWCGFTFGPCRVVAQGRM